METRVPPFKAWLRALRPVLYTVLACVIAAPFLEKVLARRALDRALAQAEADGLFAAPEAIDPASIPPEENFGALPFFSEAYDSARNRRLDTTRVRLEAAFHKASGEKYGPGDLGPPVDWAKAHALLVSTAPELGLDPATTEPARDLLEKFVHFASDALDELEAGAQRRFAVFPTTLTSKEATHDELSAVLRAARLEWAVAQLAWAVGDVDRWLRALHTLHRVAELPRAGESMVSSVASLAAGSHLSLAAAEGVREPNDRLTEAQLLTVRSLIPTMNVNEAALGYVRSAARSMRDKALHWRRHPDEMAEEVSLAAQQYDHHLAQPIAWFLARCGWVEMGVARALDAHGRLAVRVTDLSVPERLLIDRAEVAALVRDDWARHGFLAERTVSGYGGSLTTMAATHAQQQIIRTACVLEAHRRRTGHLPARLGDIPKDMLPEVPLDFDGKPLRYSLDPATGRYKLWSVGVNGTDEGGTAKPSMRGRVRWNTDREGDWVWEP